MELVNEIKKTCEILEKVIKNYVLTFRKQEVSEEDINEFYIISNIIRTIKDNVNENNKEQMREQLVNIQGEIDDLYLNLTSKVNKL